CFVISDLRDSTGALEYGVIKGNLSEISRMSDLEDKVKGIDPLEIAISVQQESQCPVLMTLGEAGMLFQDHEQAHRVAGIPLQGPLDITGAGDACLAAFSACMGIKTSVPVAIYIANLAAAISVQKLRETGSASPEEIQNLSKKHPFLFIKED
ncbi:MAG: PfkB family carbohydrate kinase, partial [Bacteroidota bacterium]